LSRRKQIVEEYFSTASGDEDWSPRYNVAPTQPVPVIRQNPKEPIREMSLMRWGLINFGHKMARSRGYPFFQISGTQVITNNKRGLSR
jgi:putative SOS response-associated peptidase YedK